MGGTASGRSTGVPAAVPGPRPGLVAGAVPDRGPGGLPGPGADGPAVAGAHRGPGRPWAVRTWRRAASSGSRTSLYPPYASRTIRPASRPCDGSSRARGPGRIRRVTTETGTGTADTPIRTARVAVAIDGWGRAATMSLPPPASRTGYRSVRAAPVAVRTGRSRGRSGGGCSRRSRVKRAPANGHTR